MSLTHPKVVTQPDGADARKVRPQSDWNAPHQWRGGKNGQIYVRDVATEHGGAWATRHLTQVTRGLFMRSHPDADKLNRLLLQRADEIVMHDGEAVGGWENLELNAGITGAGGLDTGTLQTARWYEIFAIRKKADGTKALIGHLAPRALEDSAQNGNNTQRDLRGSTASAKLAQSFRVTAANAPLVAAVARIMRVNAPSGLVWMEVQTGSETAPSGIVVARSDKMRVDTWPTTGSPDCVFLFRSRPTLIAGQRYWLVLDADYPISATDRLQWLVQTASDPYGGGNGYEFNSTTGQWVILPGGNNGDWTFRIVVRDYTALVLPTGYDQYALIGYARSASTSAWRRYVQLDRTIRYVDEVEENFNNPALAGVGFRSPDLLPVTALVAFGHGTAGARVRVGGVPDGLFGVSADTLQGGVNVGAAVVGAAEPQAALGRVTTELGYAYYVGTSASGGRAQMLGFEW